MYLFQILVNKQCTLNSEQPLVHGLLEASNSSMFPSLRQSQETKAFSGMSNDNFKTQPSSTHDRGTGVFQTRNLYRTTDNSHKFKRDGVYAKHGRHLDYPNEVSVHKVENKQNYLENSTLPFAVEYIQKRSVNMSIAYSTLLTVTQKKVVEQSTNRESDSFIEKGIHNSKGAECRTKRSVVKVPHNVEGDTRTRLRRSDEEKKNHYRDVKNEHSLENRGTHTNTSVIHDVHSSATLHNIYQVDNQTVHPHTNESLVVSIYPQYFVYTWVLCMVALASFLKLNYLVKTIVLVFMVTCYGILIIHFRSEISQCCG